MNNRVRGTDIIGIILGVVLFFLIANVFVGDDEPKCIKSGCDSSWALGSSYCYVHKPASWSNKKSYSNSWYSGSFTSSSTKKTTSTTKKNTSSSSKKSRYIYYDLYDVHEYDNGDGFADEWEEEFGDGELNGEEMALAQDVILGDDVEIDDDYGFDEDNEDDDY